jgi:ferritin
MRWRRPCAYPRRLRTDLRRGPNVATETIETAINDQLNLELSSAYVYLSMSAHFEAAGLSGFAHWMRLQAKEEVGHAMRFFDFLNDRGARVVLKAIDPPPAEFASPRAAFELALEHEQGVTGHQRPVRSRREGG